MSNGANDVVVVGDGVAGLTAGLFTARQGLDTLVLGTGESMLGLNAHLENFPGFPQGINPGLMLDLLKRQAENSGCELRNTEVTDVDRHPDGGFVLATDGAEKFDVRTNYLIGATAGNADYLRELDIEIVDQQHGAYVECTEGGRTSLDGLYVAGGLADKPLQAIVSAGHGAEVAVTVLEDSEAAFAHDWTVPTGFFTDGGGDIPPGSEEINEEQQRERKNRSRELMRKVFSEDYSASG